MPPGCVSFKSGRAILVHPNIDPATDGGLSDAVNFFAEAALAASSVRAYLSAVYDFHDFMRNNGIHHVQHGVPTPTDLDLAFYLTWRRSKGDAVGTLRSRLSAVAWHYKEHLDVEVTHGPDGGTKPLVARVLKGIARRAVTTKRVRKPVTVPMFGEVYGAFAEANPDVNADDQRVCLGAMAAAIYALLRASEYTAKKVREFDPSSTLLGRDVRFDLDPQGTPIAARLLIRAAKEDRVRATQELTVHSVDSEQCPVRLLFAVASSRRGSPAHPFFEFSDGSYLTRDRLTRRLRVTAEHLGYNGKEWASHSFRSGGAVSMAASTGMSSELLSIAGRWSSDAKQLYLRHLPASVMRDAHRRMSRLNLGDITQASLSTCAARFD